MTVLDFATVGGFLFAVAAIAVGAVLEHISLGSMWGRSAFLIVFGGTLGATALSHTMDDLRQVPRALKLALQGAKLDYQGTIEQLVSLAEKVRRSGLLTLQDDAEAATNPLIRRGLTLAVDGHDPALVREALESMSDLKGEDLRRAGAVFDTAGGYCPTIGIMGTVMGLVTVMGQLSEPEKLGPAIAVAFLATLYGVAFANLFFLPLGAKVKAMVVQQLRFDDMIIEGIMAIQSGENPRFVRERLVVYAGERKEKAEKASASGRAAQGGVRDVPQA